MGWLECICELERLDAECIWSLEIDQRNVREELYMVVKLAFLCCVVLQNVSI